MVHMSVGRLVAVKAGMTVDKRVEQKAEMMVDEMVGN